MALSMKSLPLGNLYYQAGLLAGVCAAMSLLLVFGFRLTQEPIEIHLVNDKKQLMTEVLPDELYNNQPLDEGLVLPASEGLSADSNLNLARLDEQLSAVVFESQVPGWGGDIQFIMAVNAKQEITGVRVITHKETPGLADKIEVAKSDWILSFDGLSLANTPEADWGVSKDGGSFDGFTGATITPRALVKGVHIGLQELKQQWPELAASKAPEQTGEK